MLRVAGDDFNLPLGEKRGHRRIDILVGAGDLNARVPHGHGRRCHRGATDANEVNGTNRRMHIDAKIEKTVSEGSGKLEKVESFHPNRIAPTRWWSRAEIR